MNTDKHHNKAWDPLEQLLAGQTDREVELRKDKERLDFLLQNVQQFYYPTCNIDNGYELKNREDIDQAMSSK